MGHVNIYVHLKFNIFTPSIMMDMQLTLDTLKGYLINICNI